MKNKEGIESKIKEKKNEIDLTDLIFQFDLSEH